jgi:hypothetical protein
MVVEILIERRCNMDKLDKWDVAAALIGLLAWFRGEKHSATTDGGEKDAKQKIVSILQAFVSKVDEGMWLSLIARLNEKQKWAITRLLDLLDRSRERDSFRLTVVNAPVATTIIEDEIPDPADPAGKKKKKVKRVVKVGEYSDQDTRVVFLRDIADLVDDPNWGPIAVRNMLRTHELATENKVAERALEFWNRTLDWMNGVVCHFFKVKSLDKITLGRVAKVLDIKATRAARYVNGVAGQIPDRPVADMNLGFWRHTFRHHSIQAWILIAGIVLTMAFFAIVSH